MLPKNTSQTAGLSSIWTNYQGRGITFGIWDDGVQKTHWDWNGNYEALKGLTILGSRNDDLPVSPLDGHGTSVAGLIAAENNNQGGVGIAYGSTVTAIRIFGGLDDWIILSALSQDLRISIGRGQSTDIENIITGDGNDYIVGNSLDNIIMGLRCDDEIIGGLGLDIAQYLYDMGDYAVSASNWVTTISGPEGVDQLIGIELLRFAYDLTIDD